MSSKLYEVLPKSEMSAVLKLHVEGIYGSHFKSLRVYGKLWYVCSAPKVGKWSITYTIYQPSKYMYMGVYQYSVEQINVVVCVSAQQNIGILTCNNLVMKMYHIKSLYTIYMYCTWEHTVSTCTCTLSLLCSFLCDHQTETFNTKEKCFCKTWFQVGMDLQYMCVKKKVRQQGRD